MARVDPLTRQVHGRQSNLVEEQIAWDLHEKISNEQDRDAGLVLRVSKVEVDLEAWSPCESRRSDVVAVQIVLHFISFATTPST